MDHFQKAVWIWPGYMEEQDFSCPATSVTCLLVRSPERGCVPWSVLFFDIYVATDPAFQEAGIQQLLWEGSGSTVTVCLGRQKKNSFKPGSEKLSGKQEK